MVAKMYDLRDIVKITFLSKYDGAEEIEYLIEKSLYHKIKSRFEN